MHLSVYTGFFARYPRIRGIKEDLLFLCVHYERVAVPLRGLLDQGVKETVQWEDLNTVLPDPAL